MHGFLLEDQLKIKNQGDAQISPDRSLLVYVLQHYNEKEKKFHRDIYSWDFTSSVTRPLTSTGNNSNPRFSPDGKFLAFISARDDDKSQVYLLDLDRGGEARRLITTETIEAFSWTADSQSILFSAAVFPFESQDEWQSYPGSPCGDASAVKTVSLRQAHSEKNKKRGSSRDSGEIKEDPELEKKSDDAEDFDLRIITRFSYRRDRAGYFGFNRTQNFILDLPDLSNVELKPVVRQITFGDWDHALGTLSPDGKWLCVSSLHADEPELVRKGELWLYPAKNPGEPLLLLASPGPINLPLWSPCGKFIAFGGHDNRYDVSTSWDLYLLPVPCLTDLCEDSSRLQIPLLPWEAVLNLTLPFDRPHGGGASSELQWEARNEKQWSESNLYFLMARHGSGYLYKYSQGSSQLVAGDEGRSISSFCHKEDMLVISASSPDTFAELSLIQDGRERRITAWNEEFYSQRIWAKTEKRFFCCPDDGQDLEGWLTYPLEFTPDKKYPLVHLVHGGPHGAYGPVFSFAAQLFAAQGYFVIMMNPRGSTSYGQEFACCIDGKWGDRDAADVLAGLDDALSTGYVDPDNCFLHGWSYGGYMACWLVTQTTRYRAICSGAPVSDMRSDYGTADITMANEWEYGGQPWQGAEGLMQRSALFHAAKVQTPLLMLHGENDLRCPIIQTEQFYTALKRQGKTVVMVRYPEESHGFRKPKNMLDRYRRILAWFDHFRA
ncbi:MAG: S9 family peptidase [Symbiobacteriaceae bacterium]|nr:S9 family peptidase [Symbiobacteriaceae bacterium]